MYFKDIEWENEYGKLLSDMKNYKRVADNLDLSKRKTNRETDRIDAMNRLQEEEDEARRQHDEEALLKI